MKPKRRADYAAAITLSKGKMYEYGVPLRDHLALPDNLDLEMQFPLAVGTLGDFASEIVAEAIGRNGAHRTPAEEVIFAARVLQAYDESLLDQALAVNLRLLAAAGYYLGDMPGNSMVQLSRLRNSASLSNDDIARSVLSALATPWSMPDLEAGHLRANAALLALNEHFQTGLATSRITTAIAELSDWAYSAGSPHELLMADLLGASCATRVARSAWNLLPQFSELSADVWAPFLKRSTALKEMWPSQRMLGDAGLYRGRSGVVQMPTSTGKSRATELIIRSAFLSRRTHLAVVIAPFRALCQEIAHSLEQAFADDKYNVNQIGDALLPNIDMELFSVSTESTPQVVVLTPEKLLYMLRQDPTLVQRAGLVVYDEGHQFDNGVRGVTYELLLTSIKDLLPPASQSVLISAVIQNADAISEWLLDDASRVISDDSPQARRLIAFTSLPKGKDGQLQFNVTSETEQRFFVPRVISRQKLPRLRNERADRYFPTAESGSIALYLGLRLVGNGGVAIFTGTKASAAKIVRDAVEDTFRRGIALAAPAAHSDDEELRRFTHLYSRNFGDSSYLTKAAALGIFAHHRSTPFGVRVAIEHAMRHRLIRLIVCTSTLAQGVNLPIRYLLVTSAMQGRESIKPRDFHNLMGRAGRAGMYGEGTVIFTDHRLFDERSTASFRWQNTLRLIRPIGTEPAGSSLLALLDPMRSDNGRFTLESPSPADIATLIIDNWDELLESIETLSTSLGTSEFSVSAIRDQLEAKKRVIEAIESFLMTYRDDSDSNDFAKEARALAGKTLAHRLASAEQKAWLKDVFEAVTRRIDSTTSDSATQRRFGRTLLGLDASLAIDAWVRSHVEALEEVDSPVGLLAAVWPLLIKLSTDKRLVGISPDGALRALAGGWLAGRTFGELLGDLEAREARYPYGRRMRRFDIDLVVDLCEQTLGYEFPLLIAAVRESAVSSMSEDMGAQFSVHADFLQKRLKYGLPDLESVCYFEAGFSERVVAQALSLAIHWESAESIYDVRRLAREYPGTFEEALKDFPSYFSDVAQTIAATAR